jgi:hypothetical protein
MEYSWPVPWIPMPLAMPSQRAFSGLLGEPPGIWVPASSRAQGEFGAVQTGSTALLVMRKEPLGVG